MNKAWAWTDCQGRSNAEATFVESTKEHLNPVMLVFNG